MTNLIPGEYDCVARQSINPNRLRLAHATSCDPAMAYFLIAIMHEKYFPGQQMPLVRLRSPRKGRHTARGWGGSKNGRAYVSLPETPYSGVGLPNGFLRVGLVIHEYTHALEVLKFGNTSHDARFTMILDNLLHETEQYWFAKQNMAAEVK